MLIFDCFDTLDRAETFATAVRERYKRTATVCTSKEESDKIYPFPYALGPPIVLVERNDTLQEEFEIEQLGELMGGIFVGT
jgi:hypothetical protein